MSLSEAQERLAMTSLRARVRAAQGAVPWAQLAHFQEVWLLSTLAVSEEEQGSRGVLL